MFRIFATAALTACIATTAFATTTYHSTINVSEDNGSLPNDLMIEFDETTRTAMVIDPFVNNYFGKPIPAEVSTNNDKRLTVGWSFENIESTQGRNIPRVRFRATVIKATLAAQVSSTYYFSEANSGFGSCEIVK